MDGEVVFQYVENPQLLAKIPILKPAPPYIHDTSPSIIKSEMIPPNLCLLGSFFCFVC
jgi:Mn-containing catalase